MYKLKFTRLQNEILRFLFIKSGSFTQRKIALSLGVSMTAISKALKGLVKEKMILVEKDKESRRLSIKLNDSPRVLELKRVENLKMVYESGLSDFLLEKFPGCVIILFGSYSYGSDNENSDIDIAIIDSKEKNVNLDKYVKLLEREINLNFYKDIRKISENLRFNILNGIVLNGSL